MGENSKKSGEIGEQLTKRFLETIGWHNQIQNFSLACNDKEHKSASGNEKRTHGDDKILVSSNPFYDDRTDIIHVSVKNSLNGYPESETAIKNAFKDYVTELNEIIECAKYDNDIYEHISRYPCRRNKEHLGLLIWTSSESKTVDKDILSIVSSSRPEENWKNDVFFVDGARIDFLLKVMDHIKTEKSEGLIDSHIFYCPDPGGLITRKDERHHNRLPIELIIADVIPIKAEKDGKQMLYVYANNQFDPDSYSRLISLALDFANAWPNEIKIGFSNYNAAHHASEARSAELSYQDRDKNIKPFCFIKNLLNYQEA
ncbi:hypothetical protein [Chromobacterium violaceum]|uniref:GapS4a family protein n=1 Tax=Chromobacterium violaceum TaxID=536 RepID=UPI000ADF61CE|nr:hypothetical protein [Chromobacterium violaceum]